jgi:hypothetical protein
METLFEGRGMGTREACVVGEAPHMRRSSLRLPLPLRRGPKALLCQGGRRKARNESTPPDPRLRTPPKWSLNGPPVGGVEMWAECLEAHDGAHFRAALLRYWARWWGIVDHRPSHGAAETQALGRELRDPWVQVRYTLPRASWLNQAELLLGAFRRGSWGSRQALIDHIMNSVREYNEFFAHPFRWSWTSQDLRHWVERKHLPIGCTTSATRH